MPAPPSNPVNPNPEQTPSAAADRATANLPNEANAMLLSAAANVAWAAVLDGVPSAAPAVYGGLVFAATERGTVAAIDAATGQTRWVRPIGGPAVGRLLVHKGAVVAVTRNGLVLALEAQTGSRQGVAVVQGGLQVAPALRGDRLALALPGGRVQVLELPSLRVLLTVRPVLYEIQSVLLSDESVVIADRTGTLIGHVLEGGAERWRASLHGVPSMEPVLIDGAVIAGSRRALVALEAGSGAQRWRIDPVSEPVGVLDRADGLLAALRDGRLLLLDEHGGSRLQGVLPAAPLAPPLGTLEGVVVPLLGGGIQILGPRLDRRVILQQRGTFHDAVAAGAVYVVLRERILFRLRF